MPTWFGVDQSNVFFEVHSLLICVKPSTHKGSRIKSWRRDGEEKKGKKGGKKKLSPVTGRRTERTERDCHRMRLLMLFVSLWGVAFSSVWIVQWPTREKYEVGDSAVLQCNIRSHRETLSGCKITWTILNQSNKKKTKDILTSEKYQERVKMNSNSTFSAITFDNLSADDTEPLFCTASCFIDGNLQKISGNGTSLIIIEPQRESARPWLKYLLFSVNLLVFLIVTLICVSIIRKKMRNETRTLSRWKTTEIMGLQCLISLIFLAQPFLIQSDFKQIGILCDYESNEATAACLQDDSCRWKVDLLTCQTLQMHCIENDVQTAKSFCSSSKECGFPEKFPDSLIGLLDCEVKRAENKHGISCLLTVACGNEKHVCMTPTACHWNPNPLFREIDDARCILKHDVSQCIKAHPKWNVTELNCTISPAKKYNGADSAGRGYVLQSGGFDQPCDNNTTGGLEPGCIISIVINVLLVFAIIALIVYFKKCRCKTNNTNQNTRATPSENHELESLRGGQGQDQPAGSDVSEIQTKR
ncbi:hypothetical protein AOLI_G00297700 [Acnodon oligacanthus]